MSLINSLRKNPSSTHISSLHPYTHNHTFSIMCIIKEQRQHQFGAENIWNKTIKLFKNGIKLKRKRRWFRTFKQCFSGNEAIRWFKTYAESCGKLLDDRSDKRTLALLRRLVDSGLVQCVWEHGKKRRKPDSPKNLYIFPTLDGDENICGKLFRAFVIASPHMR